MNLYSINMRICATAYIKAASADEALAIAKTLHGDSPDILDAGGDVAVSGRQYDDPNLPDVSLSPSMTIWEPCSDAELVAEGVAS